MQYNFFAILVQCRDLVRSFRHQQFHFLAQQVYALQHLSRNAGNRCDRAVTHALMNTVHPFFLGKFLAGEELFKQFLVSFRNCL